MSPPFIFPGMIAGLFTGKPVASVDQSACPSGQSPVFMVLFDPIAVTHTSNILSVCSTKVNRRLKNRQFANLNGKGLCINAVIAGSNHHFDEKKCRSRTTSPKNGEVGRDGIRVHFTSWSIQLRGALVYFMTTVSKYSEIWALISSLDL